MTVTGAVTASRSFTGHIFSALSNIAAPPFPRSRGILGALSVWHLLHDFEFQRQMDWLDIFYLLPKNKDG